MPSAHEVLALYRTFLREGRKFPNYNIREYIIRKAKEDFRAHAVESDGSKLQALWSKALDDLQVVKRQSLVYQLYGRKMKNILELEGQHKGSHVAGVTGA